MLSENFVGSVDIMTKLTTRPASDLRNSYDEMLKLLDIYDYVVFTEEGAKDVVIISMETYAIYQNLLLQQRILNRKHESFTIIFVRFPCTPKHSGMLGYVGSYLF